MRFKIEYLGKNDQYVRHAISAKSLKAAAQKLVAEMKKNAFVHHDGLILGGCIYPIVTAAYYKKQGISARNSKEWAESDNDRKIVDFVGYDPKKGWTYATPKATTGGFMKFTHHKIR